MSYKLFARISTLVYLIYYVFINIIFMQFFLCTKTTSWLDGKHTVFGYVSKGMNVVKCVESFGSSPSGKPSADIIIRDCGQLLE